jgi:hypothetical protein
MDHLPQILAAGMGHERHFRDCLLSTPQYDENLVDMPTGTWQLNADDVRHAPFQEYGIWCNRSTAGG